MRNLIRLALRAGDFREIFRLSREARALENLNRTGGVSGPGPSQRDRGDYRTEEFMSDPDFLGREYFADMTGDARVYRGNLPDGREMTFDPSTGSRSTSARQRDYPIEAPYEGFRVMPGSVNRQHFQNWGESSAPPGPWMGRGRGTEWAELPIDGGFPYDSGSYFEQIPGPRPLSIYGDLPSQFPWRAFGETQPIGRFPSSWGQTPIPFEEVMRAPGSLMGDPRFGPYAAF